MRIVISTPTGNIGRRLTERLLEKGEHELVLLARDPAKVAAAVERGAAALQGDLSDRDYLSGALEGADAFFYLIPPNYAAEDFRAFQRSLTDNVVAAVAAAGDSLKHVVLLSSVGAHLSEGTGPILGLYDAEQALRAATPRLTILRPGYFMENWLHQIASIAGSGQVFMASPPEREMPMIATADIGDRAAEVLAGPAPDQPVVLPLLGPRDYTFGECTAVLAGLLGTPVSYQPVPAEAVREPLKGMGASDSAADVMVELEAAFAAGHVVGESPRSAGNTTPTTFEQFAEQTLVPAITAAAG